MLVGPPNLGSMPDCSGRQISETIITMKSAIVRDAEQGLLCRFIT